jgi:hypothetical protein
MAQEIEVADVVVLDYEELTAAETSAELRAKLEKVRTSTWCSMDRELE